MDEQINHINILELKKKLKRGDMTKIAQKLNIPPQNISFHFSTKAKAINEEVILATIAFLKEKKEKKDQLNKLIKSAQ